MNDAYVVNAFMKQYVLNWNSNDFLPNSFIWQQKYIRMVRLHSKFWIIIIIRSTMPFLSWTTFRGTGNWAHAFHKILNSSCTVSKLSVISVANDNLRTIKHSGYVNLRLLFAFVQCSTFITSKMQYSKENWNRRLIVVTLKMFNVHILVHIELCILIDAYYRIYDWTLRRSM